jgi:hypothetical protein
VSSRPQTGRTLSAHSQYEQSVQSPRDWEAIGQQIKPEDVADHFPDPSVRKAIEVDGSLIDHYDQLLGEVELYLTRSAKTDDVQTFARLQSVPGIGQILALVI